MKKKFVAVGVILASLYAGVILAATNISIAQAKAIAAKKVPGGTVTSIELDYEGGKAVYDIDIVLNQYEYDLKLDAKTGSGISVRKELRDDYTGGSTQVPTFITSEKAKAIALKKIPGAKITKIELDSEAGRGVYEIELVLNQYEYDLKLDAKTGSGISVTKELREGYKSTSLQTQSYISRKQAKSIALKKVPGATVKKVELDREDGIYEIELRKGRVEYDVVVSAVSGQVLSVEMED